MWTNLSLVAVLIWMHNAHVFNADLILFPDSKLAFCGIPKNGITNWLQLLRFTLGAKDFQDSPHNKPDSRLFRFDKLTTASQMKVLNGEFLSVLFTKL